jgi:hypothetical protein
MPWSSSSVQRLDHPFVVALRATAVAAGDVSLYCDRAEHAEPAPHEAVANAAALLRGGAVNFADAMRVDLFALYANRIRTVELRNPAHAINEFDGGEEARRASTWRRLQEIQVLHDREYHADIVGMPRIDQVRHCALHLAKLCGWYSRAVDDVHVRDELIEQRLPDTLIFSLKLDTLARVRLDASRLPRHGLPAKNTLETQLAKTNGF